MEFNEANPSKSFSYKAKIAGWTGNNVKKIVPLKYLSNF